MLPCATLPNFITHLYSILYAGHRQSAAHPQRLCIRLAVRYLSSTFVFVID